MQFPMQDDLYRQVWWDLANECLHLGHHSFRRHGGIYFAGMRDRRQRQGLDRILVHQQQDDCQGMSGCLRLSKFSPRWGRVVSHPFLQ
jgi:hypothetical protein